MQLKTKTLQSKHLDENSMLQAIKRIHYQLYYWLQSDILENAWMITGVNVQPVCFVGKGLSPNFVSNIKQI